ncbi:MAG: phospholipase D/Transphosphatidylase [Polaromonas sp.]|nr:phospholipase D/Transphosphatidylase [Polaromonas sp.]
MRGSGYLALPIVAVAAWLVLHQFNRLPSLQGRTVSTVLTDTASTQLGRALAPLAQAHPGLSGVVPLYEGLDAFAARVLLADAAERTLDVQYYIWHPDMSGTLLAEALHRAAARGVRVRLLLDDNNTSGLDPALAALDAHPNVEVRLFNPFVSRRWRALDYLTDFPRLNRRMHNKSFTIDNQATITGGRNVGDEYFGAHPQMRFIDLDILAVGSVVREVSDDFDRYWSSASAYPVGSLFAPAPAVASEAQAIRASPVEREPAAHRYLRALVDSAFVQRLLARQLPLEWTRVRLVSDDPAKGLGLAPPEALVWQRLRRVLGQATREVQLVTPYFVPTAAGVDALAGLSAQGVQVSVLTNSLEATDVLVVHAGYAKWRVPLLTAGIGLYEMKRGGMAPERALTGSSASSLHAKVFAVDDSRLFVGSFNFDPRSANLNTEMGLAIDSAALAQAMRKAASLQVSALAYEVRLVV